MKILKINKLLASMALFVFVFLYYANVYAQITETFSSAGTYTWTCPTGVTNITVQCWGGGGGGGCGAASGNKNGGGGGGGGAFSTNTSVSVTPGTAYTITVGTSGSAGLYSTLSNGGDGGTTIATFGSTTVTANGGGGGKSYDNGRTGGTGGSSGTYNGGNGAAGVAATYSGGGGEGAATTGNGNSATNQTGATGTDGGDGGSGTTSNGTDGTAGSSPGGGGGGGTKQSNGAAGAAGKVNIVYAGSIYRSRAAGNWSSLTTWERSTNNGSTWTSGSSPDYPGQGVTGNVTITHAVTVDVSPANSFLTLTATGVTVTNNSTLTLKSGLTGTGGLTNGATGTLNLNFSGSIGITNFTTTAAGNTVNYCFAGDQTVKYGTYDKLTISGSGTKTVSSSGNTVTINSDFVISSGATFEIAGNTLSASGTTSVSGTFDDNSGSGVNNFTGKLTINSGGSWVSSNSSTCNFYGGIEHNGTTFTQTGATAYFYTNNQVISGSGAMSFNGFNIADAITVTNQITNSAGITINGTLNGGAANSEFINQGVLKLYNSNAIMATGKLTASYSPNTVYYNYTSGQNIKVTTGTPAQYHHLIIDGSSTKTVQGDYTVNGDLTITSGTLADAGFTVSVKGNVTNNGTHSGAGKIYLNSGSAQHEISGSGTFYNLDINESTYGAKLTSATQINGTLTLTAGALDLNSNTLTINNAATTAIGYTSGYILSSAVDKDFNSKVQWNMSSTTGAHVYPFGYDASNIIPFTFNLTAGTIGNVTVSTYNAGTTAANIYANRPTTVLNLDGGGLTGDPGNGANMIKRYWYISPSGTGTATVTFTYTSAEEPVNREEVNNMKGQRYNSVWQSPAGTQTSNTTTNTVEIAGLTSFSPWAIVKGSNVLPIELLSFSGAYDKEKVNLYWSTASETNNDYFTIERSTDGINFEIVTTVKGAGTSNKFNKYNTTDETAPLGIVYYRLKQTDFDGKFEYSEIIIVKVNGNVPGIEVRQPYFNGKKIEVNVKNISNIPVFVEVYDILGKVYFSEVYMPDGTNMDMKIQIENLLKGVLYFLKVYNEKEYVVKKFIY